MSFRVQTVTLVPLILPIAWAFGAEASERGYSFVETRYRSGEISIAASLFLPDGGGPHPVAVIIQGAGRSSRMNPWSMMIAEQLATRGVAAFLPDKRGTGDSDGNWNEADFADLARDIQAAVDFVADRPEIDARGIGVIGLSQGGFYAPLVAVGSPKVVFVGAVSASAMPFAETLNHEMRNTFRQEGLTGDSLDRAMAVQLAALRFVRGGAWELYEGTRAKALRDLGSEAIAEFPSGRDHWIWKWIRGVVDFDPMVHWKRVSRPMFFAYGADDEEDNVPVASSVERIRRELGARRDVVIKVYPGSGHALYDPVLAREGDLSVRSDFGEDLATWIVDRLGGPRRPGAGRMR